MCKPQPQLSGSLWPRYPLWVDTWWAKQFGQLKCFFSLLFQDVAIKQLLMFVYQPFTQLVYLSETLRDITKHPLVFVPVCVELLHVHVHVHVHVCYWVCALVVVEHLATSSVSDCHTPKCSLPTQRCLCCYVINCLVISTTIAQFLNKTLFIQHLVYPDTCLMRWDVLDIIDFYETVNMTTKTRVQISRCLTMRTPFHK